MAHETSEQRHTRIIKAQQIATAQAVADLQAINNTPNTADARAQAIAEAAAKRPTKLNKKAQQEAAKRAAEEQANRDALRMVKTDRFAALRDYQPRPGVVPPLHVQNALAQQATELQRDEAKMVADAAGKAAYDIVLGRTPRNVHTMNKRVAQMQRRTAEQKAG